MPLRKELKKVVILGSGPIVIGQAAEFDYAGTQACLALKEEGIEVVLINSNPATIMTDRSIADRVYMEPMTLEYVEEILRKEQPDGLIGTLGGQTGLNLTVNLYEKGILEKHNVELLGTSVESIQNGEDREKFRQKMIDIGESVPESKIALTIQEALMFATEIGYPIMVRPAYTLGGEGGGFAANHKELIDIVERGLSLSPINQVLIEKSMLGWKEIEYEVMRDKNDTCMIVCNMENMDPVGIHTGDSIVVAPSQTLNDYQYQMLRDVSLKVIRALDVIGGCNIQIGLNPESNDYYIIEVNPRVSRSSALASKATGYPIARMAAKCAIGYTLDELPNPITGTTYAAFEPALDYLVVKLPRFPFDKFPEGDRVLGTQMKATGEVMAIDRSFEGALNKAVRSLEIGRYALTGDSYTDLNDKVLLQKLTIPTDERLFFIGEAFKRGYTIETVQKHTSIDTWFLVKIKKIIDCELELKNRSDLSSEILINSKKLNISDSFIANVTGISIDDIQRQCKKVGIERGMKQVDTCAGEFEAITPYFYSTFLGKDEAEDQREPSILILGSGPIRIGQGVEFDYCSVHATLAVKKFGFRSVVMNNNPETVSTDYSIADRLYFEPLAIEDVLAVIEKENISGVVVQFGGQTAINLAEELHERGIPVLGTPVENINKVEDRDQFYQLLDSLRIPYIEGRIAFKPEEMERLAEELTFPIIVRPSYVIGGQNMFIFRNMDELKRYAKKLGSSSKKMWPFLLDRFVEGTECEVDVICNGNEIAIPGIMEHLERAGVHSGDSTAIYPPVSLTDEQKRTITSYCEKLSIALDCRGLMNIQFVISEGIIYVLEINPRASRTVPLMSKVTNVPIVEWAIEAQLNKRSSLPQKGLLKEQPYFTVKFPIFSNGKLKNVDHVLGPEMKSTGEVLAIANTIDEALSKAILPTVESSLPKAILCSVSNEAKKASLPLLDELTKKGIKVFATPGTYHFLDDNSIPSNKVGKNTSEIEELLNGEIEAIISIPTIGREKDRFGFKIRALGTRYKIPCFTHLDTLQLINMSVPKTTSVTSIQEWHAFSQVHAH
ncbi:carbamoyl-phosphate synthase (glutamine-hydrolyzing) large subunit [Guptibacillus algicola]|uniref:carbamoyl-phosphate synthase (glutamine-hydrolyzing) large subunit n=1 Tax=Guptibacillus algicola TaxID=225844 RepID=UPI001CD7DDF2|nr:carbamoyl-phosphate synthase (glutamine-hydrolyzing) large subunit [Alkalihalobacillus algicola]MCA0988267.1 carbamoyl-phosphate synthase (glutamine-hydrolyzing) large subunit [Alkalihalobacillus algicola]